MVHGQGGDQSTGSKQITPVYPGAEISKIRLESMDFRLEFKSEHKPDLIISKHKLSSADYLVGFII